MANVRRICHLLPALAPKRARQPASRRGNDCLHLVGASAFHIVGIDSGYDVVISCAGLHGAVGVTGRGIEDRVDFCVRAALSRGAIDVIADHDVLAGVPCKRHVVGDDGDSDSSQGNSVGGISRIARQDQVGGSGAREFGSKSRGYGETLSSADGLWDDESRETEFGTVDLSGRDRYGSIHCRQRDWQVGRGPYGNVAEIQTGGRNRERGCVCVHARTRDIDQQFWSWSAADDGDRCFDVPGYYRRKIDRQLHARSREDGDGHRKSTEREILVPLAPRNDGHVLTANVFQLKAGLLGRSDLDLSVIKSAWSALKLRCNE